MNKWRLIRKDKEDKDVLARYSREQCALNEYKSIMMTIMRTLINKNSTNSTSYCCLLCAIIIVIVIKVYCLSVIKT
jgi:hypothetical protein